MPIPFDQGRGLIHEGASALAHIGAEARARGRRIFLLSDANTYQHCRPILLEHLSIDAEFSIPAGEEHKTLSSIAQVWQAMGAARLTRHDLLINLGGGVVCDLGGFAASTYKRGIAFIHVPTSLLAMADAAIGGKTGIDFDGYKNQVGTFAQPEAIVVEPAFLKTLPPRELRSGMAEVLKHMLIHDAAAWQAISPLPPASLDMASLAQNAIRIKLHFTESDLKEQSIRKALNFGHTVGHALESHFLATRPPGSLTHGEAVAVGMWAEAWLSLQKNLLQPSEMEAISACLAQHFPKVMFLREEVGQIAHWALQDKKNDHASIKAVLLRGIGDFALDQALALTDVQNSLFAYLDHYPR